MTVVAFDIDGTLTEDEVLKAYRELKNRNKITTGIVTRRTPRLAQQFIEQNNLQPDFVRSRVVKSIAFNSLEDGLDGDKFIYVGNRFTDKWYAVLSGWQFIPAYQVDSSKSIIL